MSHLRELKKKQLRLSYYNEGFQLRYGLWLASIGFFCFLLMGFLIYLSVSRLVKNSVPDELAQVILTDIVNPKQMFLRYEVLLPLVIMTSFLFAIGIVGTHKIAGPLFAIKRYINRTRTGVYTGPLQLRKNDLLQDLAFALNNMITKFKAQETSALQTLNDAKANLEAGRVDEALEILNKKRDEARRAA